MEHPNAALVRMMVAGYGDPEMVATVFASDASWTEPGDSPISGRYVGREAIAALMREILALSGGTFTIDELVEVLAGERHGLAVLRVHGTHGGRLIETIDRLLFTFSSGHISDVLVVSEDQAEVDAFWSDYDPSGSGAGQNGG